MSDKITLNELSLTNFKSYELTELILKPLTLILGTQNGAGKTSIADALSYLFCGRTPSFNSKQREHLIQHGKDVAKLRAKGRLGTQDVKIIREIRGKDYVTLTIGTDEYTFRVSKQILESKVPFTDFNHLLYINGHHILSLLEKSPLERTKIIDELIGVENIHKLITLLSAKKQTQKERQLRQKLETLQLERTQLQQHHRDVANELKIHLAEVQEKTSQINNEVSAILDDNLESVNTTLNLRNEIQSLTHKIELKNQQLEMYRQQLEQIKTRMKQQKEQQQSLKQFFQQHKIRTTKECQKTLQKYDTYLTRVKRQKTQIQRELLLWEQILKLQTELSAQNHRSCPVCQQDLTAHTFDSTKTTEQIQQYQQQYNTLQEKYETCTARRAKIQNYWQSFVQIRQQLKTEKTAMKTLFQKMMRLETELQTFETELAEKQEVYSSNPEMSEKLVQLQQLKTTIKTLEQQQDTTKLDEVNVQIEEVRQELQHVQDEIEKRNLFKERFKLVLKDIRERFIRDKINPNITKMLKYLNQYESSYPKIDYQLQITETNYGYRYVDSVTLDRNPILFEELSSGQKIKCAMALQLALMEISHNQLGIIIFDEFSSMGIDTEGMEQLLRIIIALVKQKGIQILVLERDPEILRQLAHLCASPELISRYKLMLQQDHIGRHYTSHEMVPHF